MSQSPPPSLSPRRTWWRAPAALVLVGATVFGVLHYLETAERMTPADARLAKFALVGLTSILLFAWYVFFGPTSRKIRARVGMLGAALVVLLVGSLRIEGVSGDIMPALRFRWMPHADEILPDAQREAAASGVDLTATTADDYPQFLGQGRNAMLSDPGLARDWSADPPKLIWKRPIGAAWSSFAVVGHFGVTQEQRGTEELVSCYDLDDGKLMWAHSTPVRFNATIAGTGPRATPTIAEGKVYAMGAEGHVVCLDGTTGKEIWKHDAVKENDAHVPQWGKSCSPLVYDNLVIVSAGGHQGKSLVAYNKQTSEVVWSAGNDASSYSSPTVFELAGEKQIVIVNETSVAGHDPADGHIIWQHPWPDTVMASPNVAQPVAVGEDRILLTKGYGVGSALWQVAHKGDEWSVEELWRTKNMKTKFTNPVIHAGYAYGLDEGVLSCIEIASGKRKWKQGHYDHGQVLLVGDLLLVQSEKGVVALVAAEPDAYRELTRFTAVAGQSWNCPVLSGRRLIVRSEEEAACYELPLATP